MLVLLLVAAGVPVSSMAPGEAEAQQAAGRPNIILILTDDQDAASIGRMDTLQNRLVDAGTSFSQAYATTPQCCPSRATFLRGQYAHNHGIVSNKAPRGGWDRFRASGGERSTVATWLDRAGYKTAYMGKYLNGYGRGGNTRYVPPGWDSFYGWQGNYNEFDGSYKINNNGRIETYERKDLHDTDYLSRRAEGFIRSGRGPGSPWFLVVAPNAPHGPAFAAERHRDMFRNAKMPRPPSFNEANVTDKPSYVRVKPRLNAKGIKDVEEDWRQRQRALQSVDDLVGNVVSTLERTRQMRDTYVVYATDNGYSLYRHRMKAKGSPYEEAIRLPFVVRGPGVPSRATRGQLIANTDFAPTVADWAGVDPPAFVDGRSIDPLLSASPPARWRGQLLLEFYTSHPFRALRTSDGKTYVEYEDGFRELYDTDTDRYQLTNSYRRTGPALVSDLEGRLAALRNCERAGCRTAENGP